MFQRRYKRCRIADREKKGVSTLPYVAQLRLEQLSSRIFLFLRSQSEFVVFAARINFTLEIFDFLLKVSTVFFKTLPLSFEPRCCQTC